MLITQRGRCVIMTGSIQETATPPTNPVAILSSHLIELHYNRRAIHHLYRARICTASVITACHNLHDIQ